MLVCSPSRSAFFQPSAGPVAAVQVSVAQKGRWLVDMPCVPSCRMAAEPEKQPQDPSSKVARLRQEQKAAFHEERELHKHWEEVSSEWDKYMVLPMPLSPADVEVCPLLPLNCTCRGSIPACLGVLSHAEFYDDPAQWVAATEGRCAEQTDKQNAVHQGCFKGSKQA